MNAFLERYGGLVERAFAAIAKGVAFLEQSECTRVARALRILYFYPDEILSCLHRLAEGKDDVKEVANQCEGYLDRTEDDVERELDFLVSDSVATNLRLTIEDVVALRRLANWKTGVRNTLWQLLVLAQLPEAAVNIPGAAREILPLIELLNAEITSIEKAMRAP